MKNYLLISVLFLFISSYAFGQTESNIQEPLSINNSGALPDSSAMLDVAATDRGMLIPRMSTSDRLGIASPAFGLLVYDTTISAPCHFTGSVWKCLVIPPPADTCFTLDQSYDCGGPGFGRTIDVDAGAVTLNGIPGAANPTIVVTSASPGIGAMFNQTDMGPIARFTQTNAGSPSNGVTVTHAGMGIAHQINSTNMLNGASSLEVNQAGMGNAAFITTTDIMNGAVTLQLDQQGMGPTAYLNSYNMMNPSSALHVDQFGMGSAGELTTFDPTNPANTLTVSQMGLGNGGHFSTIDAGNMANTVMSAQFGLGHAGHFESHNPGTTMATVRSINQGNGDGVHGIATDSAFTVSGVTGTGRYDAQNAAALHAHDGAIRVSKTFSPNTPAEVFDTMLVSWLPMADCPSAPGCPPGGAGTDNYAWNSDIIFVPNVYVDPARSVITHTTEVAPPFFLRSVTRGVVPGGFMVQFVVDMDMCTGICGTPPSIPIRLHYLIVNR